MVKSGNMNNSGKKLHAYILKNGPMRLTWANHLISKH
jgi:hypothetical protein